MCEKCIFKNDEKNLIIKLLFKEFIFVCFISYFSCVFFRLKSVYLSYIHQNELE
jgi:hypothetical protein